MQIVNQIFAPAVAGMTDPSDNSLLTLGVYALTYSSLVYTLANSAFKLIDMLPNWVMTWIGARMEQRADDAAAIQQQSQQYIQTMAYSSHMEGADLGGKRAKTSDINTQAELARNLRESPTFQAKEQGKTETQMKQDAWDVAGAKMGITDTPKTPPK
jgi:hypothetical protein